MQPALWVLGGHPHHASGTGATSPCMHHLNSIHHSGGRVGVGGAGCVSNTELLCQTSVEDQARCWVPSHDRTLSLSSRWGDKVVTEGFLLSSGCSNHPALNEICHSGGYGGFWAEEGIAVDSAGDCIKAEGFDHVLCVAWRGDNDGGSIAAKSHA